MNEISRRWVMACLAVGLSARSLLAQPAKPQLVAKDLVSGRTLTVTQYNFAVRAPGNDWEWLPMPLTTRTKGTTDVCRQSSTVAPPT